MKICLDAGHYGNYNRSPVVANYWESKMTWDLHLKLKAELEKYKDVTAITTREDQAKDLDVTARGKMSKGCDLFLSLHSNAADKESVDHIVIFIPVDDTTTDIDEKSEALAKKLAARLTTIMGVIQKNYRVASVKSSNDRNKDGILNDNYYGVLHGARQVNTPAMIIEHSFHTNKRAAEWLLVDENLQLLAEEEAKIIAEHYKLKKLVPAKRKIWRVQAGAYLFKKNAEHQLEALKKAGYAAFIVKTGIYYKVQAGAYESKDNAVNFQRTLKTAGFSAHLVEAYI